MSSVIRGLLLRIGYLFDSLYMAFNLRFQDSFDNLIDDRGIVPLLLSFLLIFEVLWVAIRCILQQNMSLPEILMKFFLVIITILFINNLDWFVDGIKTLFSTAGYTAADATSRNDPSAYGVGYIVTPSEISSSALTCFAPIESVIQAINNYILYLQSSAGDGGLFSGITGPVIAFLQCIPYYFFLICAYIVEIILLVVLSFALINISLWLIEFGLLLIIGTFCLPFQIFEPTKFLGKGVWPVLFGQGLKLFVIVYLVNLIPELLEPTLSSFILAIDTSGTSLPYGEIMTGLVFSIITVITYCYLLIKAPSIALGLITGTPTMETVGSHFVTMMGAKGLNRKLRQTLRQRFRKSTQASTAGWTDRRSGWFRDVKMNTVWSISSCSGRSSARCFQRRKGSMKSEAQSSGIRSSLTTTHAMKGYPARP